MQLPERDNRGKNTQAIYNRASWDGPDHTRKRNSPHDDVRNKNGVDDEVGTSSQSVKPSSTPAQKKSKSTSTNVTTRKGKGKLKSKSRRRNRTQNCHVKDMSCSRVDVDVNLTAQASQQSNGKCRVFLISVLNTRPADIVYFTYLRISTSY